MFENVVHDNNSHNITNYSKKKRKFLDGSCGTGIIFPTRGHRDLYLVVHAFGYYDPLNTGDIFVIDPIIAIV